MHEISSEESFISLDSAGISIRTTMPHILDILLLDRTTSSPNKSQNIIWANDHYQDLDANLYAPTAQIKPELITGERSSIIMPRALKSFDTQKKRTKTSAEVFTPAWIVKNRMMQ